MAKFKQSVRNAVLKPFCQHCGGIVGLVAHHIKRRRAAPELVNEPSNLITLCGFCHGHLHNDSDFERRVYDRIGIYKKNNDEIPLNLDEKVSIL